MLFPESISPPLEKLERFVAGQQEYWEKFGYGNWGILPEGQTEIIGGAGVDKVGEQDAKRPEAMLREMLVNRVESRVSTARCVSPLWCVGGRPVSRAKHPAKYLLSCQATWQALRCLGTDKQTRTRLLPENRIHSTGGERGGMSNRLNQVTQTPILENEIQAHSRPPQASPKRREQL